MNIISAFEAGQKGNNKGLPMGEGLASIANAINNLQRGRIFTVAASPKGGKSTLVDVGFCIEPALYVLEHNKTLRVQLEKIAHALENTIDSLARDSLNLEYTKLISELIELEIIYNSYEIDRVSKEFDFITHFLNRDFGILNIPLEEGRTYKGKNFVPLSSAFLKGEVVYDKREGETSSEIIKVSPQLLLLVQQVYRERIIPLFGEYNKLGEQVSKGIIIFLENKENPTGIRNYLLDYAEKNGELFIRLM